MAELNCHIVTFNCGRKPVDLEYFASSLFSNLQSAASPADLIVLAVQEIAPIAESFLGGTHLDPFLARLQKAVHLATSWISEANAEWEHVASQCLGMTGVMVFARRDIHKMVRWSEEAGVGFGLQGMGNKGAAGLRVVLQGLGQEDITLTFVAAHLAPHEAAWERRNLDWRSICEGLVFEKRAQDRSRVKETSSPEEESEPLLRQDEIAIENQHVEGSSDLFSPPSYLFFAGDLNYRTSDTKPAPDAHSTWPQSTSSLDTHLLAKDQLTREREKARTLHGLAEAPITFAPTYKFSSAAQLRAAERADSIRKSLTSSDATMPKQKLASLARDESIKGQDIWAKHRVPSWCDRVLYLSTAPIQVHSYTALPVQPTSDHRPVVLSCSIPRRALRSEEAVEQPFAIRPGWKQRQAAAHRMEIAAGVAVYLTCTTQGQTILVSSVLGLAIVGFLLGYAMGGS